MLWARRVVKPTGVWECQTRRLLAACRGRCLEDGD